MSNPNNNVPANLVPAEQIQERALALGKGFYKLGSETSLLLASAIYEAVLTENATPLNFLLAQIQDINPKIAPNVRRAAMQKAPISEKDITCTVQVGETSVELKRPLKYSKARHEQSWAGRTARDFFMALENENLLNYKSIVKKEKPVLTQEKFDKQMEKLLESGKENGLKMGKYAAQPHPITTVRDLYQKMQTMLSNADLNKLSDDDKTVLEAWIIAGAKSLELALEKAA